MKSYYQDNHNTLYCKDCRQMTELADNSIQCVVTSPPYWGLRKYSGEQELIWGGDKDCEHQWVGVHPAGYRSSDTNPGKLQSIATQNRNQLTSNTCSLCGAWKGAYGLEPTPEMYVQHTIEILREIRRVLRKDGVVFWNIGDSYATHGVYIGKYKETHPEHTDFHTKHSERYPQKRQGYKGGSIKPKDLCLIPFRIALAAQGFAAVSAKEILQCADYLELARKNQDWQLVQQVEDLLRIWSQWAFLEGWWDRSIIIWSKPNPMPESVTDRPTESHEYILMLTKSSRYYWDQDAVRREYTEPLNRWGGPEFRESSHKYIELGGHDGQQKYGATSMFREGRPVRPNPNGANIRTVWEFPTQPYPEAHFAVFPEKLPELCIKAATPEVGCCSKCGAPWERIRKPTKDYEKALERMRKVKDRFPRPAGDWHSQHAEDDNQVAQYETIGWQTTCKCNADKVPSLVLDPFAGAGTTLWVAKTLNRRAVGYEISQEYCNLALERNRQQVLELS